MNTRQPEIRQVLIGDDILDVYIARTIRQTYVGLGGRDDVGDADGMLFLFDVPARHGIVMRDMKFSIDIIWLYDGQIVDIAPGVPIEPGVPESSLTVYRPRTEATMVLELPAGSASAYQLRIGDRMTSL